MPCILHRAGIPNLERGLSAGDCPSQSQQASACMQPARFMEGSGVSQCHEDILEWSRMLCRERFLLELSFIIYSTQLPSFN